MSGTQTTNDADPLQTLGPNAAHATRNRRLGIWGGAFAGISQSLLQPEIIFAGLVYEATRSTMLAALVAVLNKVGSLAPPMLVSSLVEHRPLRRPYFIGTSVAMFVSLVVLLAVMALSGDFTSPWALTLFFGVYLIVCVFAGTRFVLFMDMTGRLIRPDQIGGFLGMRTFLGGGIAMACGLLVVHPILAYLPLPTNYVVLGAIGTLFMAADAWLWTRCHEEPGPVAPRRTTPHETFARGLRWLKTDRDYRCYLLMRIAFRINYTGIVLMIPYGTQHLAKGRPENTLAILGGILLTAGTLSLILSSLIWGRIADRFGSRTTLLCAGVCQLSAPLLALLAPRLPVLFSIDLPGGWALDLPMCTFIFSLAAFRAGLRGDMIGGQRFLLLNAPVHRRTAYITFLNAITSPLALLPLAGAWLGETVGMDWLFMAVACGGVMSIVGALRMSKEL